MLYPHLPITHTCRHTWDVCVLVLCLECVDCVVIIYNLQLRMWPQLCMCSSSPLTVCWDITFICIGRPFVTNLAVELTCKAFIQAVELQWKQIWLHSLLHRMVHPLLYNYIVPKVTYKSIITLQFSQHLRTRNLMIYLRKSILNPSQTEQQIVKSSSTI